MGGENTQEDSRTRLVVTLGKSAVLEVVLRVKELRLLYFKAMNIGGTAILRPMSCRSVCRS